MLNYVILTTYSSHHYSMWDFTHTYNLTISPSHVSLCLSMGFKTSLWTMNKSYSLSLLPNGPFPSLVHHPWASTCQPRMSFILYGNLASHRCLTPLAIILICWTFSKIVCVGFMGLLGAIYRPYSNYKKDSPPCSICKRALSTHLVLAPTTEETSLTLPPLFHTPPWASIPLFVETNTLGSFLK